MIFVSFYIKKNIIPCSYCAPFVPPNLGHTHNSNLYLAKSLAAAVTEPAPYRFLTFQVPNLTPLLHFLRRTKK